MLYRDVHSQEIFDQSKFDLLIGLAVAAEARARRDRVLDVENILKMGWEGLRQRSILLSFYTFSAK